MNDKKESAFDDQRLVKALSHPLRVRILDILTQREASPSSLASLLGVSRKNISYHMSVLVDCDCIELVRIEPRRGTAEHFYRAKPRSSIGHRAFGAIPRSLRGDVTASALRRFIGQVVEALADGRLDDPEKNILASFPVFADTGGEALIMEIMVATNIQLDMVHSQSVQRAAIHGKPLKPFLIGLAAFELPQGKPKKRKR